MRKLFFSAFLVLLLAGCTSQDFDDLQTNVDNLDTSMSELNEALAEVQGSEDINSITSVGLIMPMGDNWDSDADNDGITFRIKPEDSEGDYVRAPATITAKVWTLELDMNTFEQVPTDLIVDTTIEVTMEDYDTLWSDELQVSFIEGYTPSSMDFGRMEITFTTEFGSYSARADTVILS